VQRPLLHAAAIVVFLAVVAAIAPAPAESNRNFYEESGREVVMRRPSAAADSAAACLGGDCFRPLIPVVLDRLPTSSIVKWKTYAVVANAIGAFAMGRWCLVLGLSSTAALGAMWLAALGAGTLYSLFDAYTGDPLMYMLSPVMAIWIWRGRYARASAAGVVGIFAKEFAAAPLWIFMAFEALDRRWRAAARLLAWASAVTLVWLATHASYMALENYAYGSTASADLLHGGFLATWLRSVGIRGAVAYLFTSFGALYLLWPFGLVRGSRELRLLAIAAVPALAAFVYVEQPERALWNFHFIVLPLAAMILQQLSGPALTVFVASFGVANLRWGAQLPIRNAARGAFLVSLIIAAIAVIQTLRQKTPPLSAESRAATDQRIAPLRAWSIATASVVVLVLLVSVLVDVRAHRQGDGRFGVNQWGYRGPLVGRPHPGVHIAVVGGTAAFAAQTPSPQTLPAQLVSDINARLDWNRTGGPFASIANIAEPGAGARSYVAAISDFAYQKPDVIFIYDGYDDESSEGSLGRHRSVVFRLTGYLPRSPWRLLRGPSVAPDVEAAPAATSPRDASSAAMIAAVRAGLQQGSDVFVAPPPYLSPAHEARQRSLAEELARTFANNPRFHYVDLGRITDVREAATTLSGAMLDVIRARGARLQ